MPTILCAFGYLLFMTFPTYQQRFPPRMLRFFESFEKKNVPTRLDVEKSTSRYKCNFQTAPAVKIAKYKAKINIFMENKT